MKIDKLSNYKRGWICGLFLPSLCLDNFEVGVHSYKAGEEHQEHFHMLCQEINTILDGECEFIINSVSSIVKRDDIVVIEPNERTKFKAITDCRILVVKTSSDLGDKYLVN